MKANLSVITILIAGFYSDFLGDYKKLLPLSLFFALAANLICFYNPTFVQVLISQLISQKLFTLTLFILVWKSAPQHKRGRYIGMMLTLCKLATILIDLLAPSLNYSWNSIRKDLVKIASLALPLIVCSFFFYGVYSQKIKNREANTNKVSIPLEIRLKAYLKSFQLSKQGFFYLIILSFVLLALDIGMEVIFKKRSLHGNISLWKVFCLKDMPLLLLYYPLGYLFDLFHKNNKFLALCGVGGAVALIIHMHLLNWPRLIPFDVLFGGFLFKMYLLNEASENSYGRTLALYESVLYIMNLFVQVIQIFHEKLCHNAFKYSLLAILAIMICILFIYPRQAKSNEELTQ